MTDDSLSSRRKSLRALERRLKRRTSRSNDLFLRIEKNVAAQSLVMEMQEALVSEHRHLVSLLGEVGGSESPLADESNRGQTPPT